MLAYFIVYTCAVYYFIISSFEQETCNYQNPLRTERYTKRKKRKSRISCTYFDCMFLNYFVKRRSYCVNINKVFKIIMSCQGFYEIGKL